MLDVGVVEILASTTSSSAVHTRRSNHEKHNICDFPNEPTPKDHFKCRYSTNKYPELYGKLESFMFQQSTNGQDIRRDSGVIHTHTHTHTHNTRLLKIKSRQIIYNVDMVLVTIFI